MAAIIVVRAASIQQRFSRIFTGVVHRNKEALSVITCGTNMRWHLADGTKCCVGYRANGKVCCFVRPSTADLAVHVEDRKNTIDRLLLMDQWLCPWRPS